MVSTTGWTDNLKKKFRFDTIRKNIDTNLAFFRLLEFSCVPSDDAIRWCCLVFGTHETAIVYVVTTDADPERFYRPVHIVIWRIMAADQRLHRSFIVAGHISLPLLVFVSV